MQNGVTPAASGAPKQSTTRTAPVRTSSVAKLPSGLDHYIQSQQSAEFVEIQKKWSNILQSVKEEKVTIHAWFVNGEPVSVWEDAVLVAFKNDIHRETTEKQGNKQLIEQVLSRYAGKPMRLVTMMLKDWTEACQGQGGTKQESPVLEMSHDDEPGKSDKPWIDEALEIFGDDLVVFKD
ncbi:DNA polymerase III subunits gamma and tau [compost metagenome]